MKTLRVPQSVQSFIEQYRHLEIGEQEVRVPYYRNVKRVRGELNSLVGKGSPKEISDEVKIYGKLRDFNIKKASAEEIRQFMEEQGIGLDCSGFAVHVIDNWLRGLGMGRLFRHIKPSRKNDIRNILYPLKYHQGINADNITNEENNIKVDLKDIRPGDLIRLRGARRGMHVLMVYEVTYGENDIPVKIIYVHSAEYYGDQNGVKFGEIEITDINKPLEEQNWTEVDEKGKNWSKTGYTREVEDNGIRRLKVMNKMDLHKLGIEEVK